MKPHPRIRKAIKWGGAAVTVLLVVVWIGSGWGYIGYRTPGRMVWIIAAGGFSIQQQPFAPGGIFRPGWTGGFEALQFFALPDWSSSANSRFVFVPLWIPAGAAAGVTVLAWRLDTLARRRARLNLCPKCNYDRAGLGGIAADAKCPECGEVAP